MKVQHLKLFNRRVCFHFFPCVGYCSNSPFLLKSASLLNAKGTFLGVGWGNTGCSGGVGGSVGLVQSDGGASVGWV
jgi:hypothetical protein